MLKVCVVDADLKTMATKLNPSLGYWNPTSLTEMSFWGQGQEATIGWLRHVRTACPGADGKSAPIATAPIASS